MPWSAADSAEVEADTNDLLGECGFAPRPAGRVWLLRLPPGYFTRDDVVTRLVVAAELRRLFDAMPYPDGSSLLKP